MSDQKICAWIGSLIKTVDQGILCLLIKIDHYISAEDNVKFQPELDWVHQVECPEDHV